MPMWQLESTNQETTYMQSVPITTDVVSSNLDQDEEYNIEVVSDLLQVGGLNPDTLVSTTNKIDCHDMTEILLKVAISTIA